MSHVSSPDPACVSTWLALDAHKLSLVAGVLPAAGGEPELVQIENTERSVRRLVAKLGGPEGLYCCYEAGPTGYELYRLLTSMGVSCFIVAPLQPDCLPCALITRTRNWKAWPGFTGTCIQVLRVWPTTAPLRYTRNAGALKCLYV